MSDLVLDIALETAAFARRVYQLVGLHDVELMATLTIYEHLAREGHMCELRLLGNRQIPEPAPALFIQHGGAFIRSRVYAMDHASTKATHAQLDIYAAFPVPDIHIVTEVHLGAEDASPHVHVRGWLTRGGDVWKKHIGEGTDARKRIPLDELRPFSSLLSITDRRTP